MNTFLILTEVTQYRQIGAERAGDEPGLGTSQLCSETARSPLAMELEPVTAARSWLAMELEPVTAGQWLCCCPWEAVLSNYTLPYQIELALLSLEK